MEAAKSATAPHTVLTALIIGLCKRLICVVRPSLSIRPYDGTTSLWLAREKRLGRGWWLSRIHEISARRCGFDLPKAGHLLKPRLLPVFCGDVAELVDAADLKSVDFGRPGSIPGVPTTDLGAFAFGDIEIRHAFKLSKGRG